MKKAVVICSLVWVTVLGFAQSIPLYSLNFDNRFVYNPARAGFNQRPELYLMYRKQWVDFNGAPETRAASFDMSVGKGAKGGIGFYVFNDITDVFNTWGGSFSYAYHLRFKNDMHRLSIGLAAGLQQYRFDRDKAFVQNTDDPLLQGDNGLAFDGSAGIHYFVTKGALLNLSVGISALSIYATDLQFLNDAAPTTLFVPDRHYMSIVSNRFKLIDEKLILEPMVTVRLTEAMNYQIEPGLLVGFKDWVWVSGAYRFDYGITIGGGFKVHDAVKIGYAYDLALNEIKDHTQGTHEIIIGILFGKNEDVASKKEVEDLRKQMAEQDSLVREMNDNQDSLLNTIDQMNYQMEDMQYRIDSLEEAIANVQPTIDDSTLQAMLKNGKLNSPETQATNKEIEKMRKDLEDLKKQKEDMEKSVKETKTKVKDMQNEMTEEKTKFDDEQDLVVKRGPALGDYFMVVGSFRVEQNSYNFQEDLKKKGYDAGVVYDKKRQWYYTYIAQPKELDKGLKDLYKLREENPEFHDAWIHILKKAVR